MADLITMAAAESNAQSVFPARNSLTSDSQGPSIAAQWTHSISAWARPSAVATFVLGSNGSPASAACRVP
jgi:hypothetical protein